MARNLTVKKRAVSPHSSAWSLHGGGLPDSVFHRHGKTVVVERLGTDRGGRVRVTVGLMAVHARKPERASVAKMPTADEMREALDRLANEPYPAELRAMAEDGLQEWAASLPSDEPADWYDESAFTPVRWVEGTGWIYGDER